MRGSKKEEKKKKKKKEKKNRNFHWRRRHDQVRKGATHGTPSSEIHSLRW